MSLVQNASTKDRLTLLLVPALFAKSMISFLLSKNYISERDILSHTGFGHGFRDEEKKNTSDKFELHFELGNSRNIAVELIGFLCSRKGVNLKPTIYRNCQDKYFALLCGVCGVTAL